MENTNTVKHNNIKDILEIPLDINFENICEIAGARHKQNMLEGKIWMENNKELIEQSIKFT
jgi:hypothetical protein